MAYKYSFQTPDGQTIEFESPTMLTRDQARNQAYSIAEQQTLQQRQLESTAEESRGVFGTARDLGLGLAGGAARVAESAGGIAQLSGAEAVGMEVQDIFGGMREGLSEATTPQIQARQQLMDQRLAEVEGEGFLPELGAGAMELLSNPSLLAQFASEQVAQLAPIARAGRLARETGEVFFREGTERALSNIGVGGAASAAGALQGADVGMETYDRVYDELVSQGVDPVEANERARQEGLKDAVQAGGITVATTFAIPGGGAVERALIGRQTANVGRGVAQDTAEAAAQAAGRAPVLRGAARGTLGEAAQEGVEEGSGAYLSNISAIDAGADIDPMAGVGTQAGFGAVLGGAFGLPAGVVQGRRDRRAVEALQQQAQQEAQEQTRQQAERRTAGVMQQQDLPGFEPGALPEVQGPPAPPAETTPEPEFQLEPSGDLGISERQGELDLQPPAAGQPSVRGPSGQRGFDFRSTQEQLDAIESQLADFNQVFGDLTPSERRQVRRGLIEERDRLQNELILNPRPAEAAATTFESAQPDLLGFYQPTPETSGAVEAEAETRDQARQRIEAARRRQAGETFGGPQRELELGTPVEPNVLTEERLAEFGLPAQARRPDRVRANFKKIAQRFEGRDLTDPEQRAQVESELAEIENRDAQWVEPFSQRMRQELQATEQQAEALRAERERIGLEQAEREAAPRRALQEDVDFAVERGMQEEQDYRARAQAQRREAEAQTQEEQRRAALRRQLVDRQAERVREQATGRIPLTQEWKDVARTQLRQRQEEAQMRERGLDQMAEQEAADFELDMQYVEDTAPQLETGQKVAASDFVQQFTEAQALNDPDITQAIEQEARNQLGTQQWGRLKSGLSNQRRAQQRRLDREARGEVQPEQPDLFAQPEPRGDLFSGVETVEGAFDQQTEVIDAERRRLRESPTFDATTSTSRDARAPEQTTQTDQTIQTTLIGTGQVNGGFSVSVNFDENQGVDVPQGELVDPNANPTTNPDREANHLPSIQSDLDASPLSQWTQTLSDEQRQELSSRVEQAYPKLTPRTSKFVYELPQPLGVVFNSTLFLNTDKFYNKNKDFLYYRVLAHEAGHLTHSNHASELDALVRNNPAEIEAELINISTALYGNFDQQRVALQDHKYLASPNELLAELNTYRMVYPEWAQTYAPRLTNFLENKQSSLTNGNSQFPHPETNWDDSDWQNAEITFSRDGNGVPIGVTAESNGKTLQQRIAGFNVDGMRDRPNFRARYIARMFGEVNDSTGEVNPVAIDKIESAIANEFAPEVEDAGRPTEDAEQPTPRRRGGRRAARREPEPAADERAAEPSVDVGGEQRTGAAEPSETPDAGGVGRRSAPASTDTDGVPASDATLEGLPPIALPLQRAITAPTETNTNAVLNQANQDGVLSDEQLEDFRQKIQRGEQARAKAIMHVYNEVRDYEYFTANPSAALSMDRQIQSVRQAAGVTRAATDAEIDAQVQEDLGPIDDDTDIVFSRAPFVNKQLSKAEDLKKTFSKLLNRVKDTVEVEVVQSSTDIPDLDIPTNVRGVYYKGKVYIVADAVSEFDFETVLAHEVVGHAGMEQLLGRSAFNNLVNQINKLKSGNARMRRIIEAIRREYTNPQGEYALNDKQEAREIIAHIAESKASYLSDSGIRRAWDNIVRRVRAALSKLGFVDPADVLLDQLIYEAAMHVEGGRNALRKSRVFLRPETMAAHTMQRAWDKGYRGFDVEEAGQHVRDIAEGRKEVPDPTQEDIANAPVDDSFYDQVNFSRRAEAARPVNDGFDSLAEARAPSPQNKSNPAKDVKNILSGEWRLRDTFRVRMIDAAATVEDKIMRLYNNAVVNSQGVINPMVSYVQSLRSEGLAASVLRAGSLVLDRTTGLWNAVRRDGVPSITDVNAELGKLGDRIGHTNAVNRFHAATIAQRELEIDRNNAELQRKADAQRARGRQKEASQIEEGIVDLYPNLDGQQIAERQRENRELVKLFNQYPELQNAFDMFTKFKNGQIDAMVEAGVVSKEYAAELKDNVAYVPFNRLLDDADPGTASGYEVHTSGLMRIGEIKRLRGSPREIDNVIDNMAKLSMWMTQAAVRNHAAREMVRGLREVEAQSPGTGVKEEYASLQQVPAADRPNAISWKENGKLRFAVLHDPLDAYAWRGTESANIPMLRPFAALANFLRKGITLSPDFILSQIQQDTFRSYGFGGLKNPARGAVRVSTSWWNIRQDLRRGTFGEENLNRYGIVGQFDYMPEQARQTAEAAALGEELTFSNQPLAWLLRWGERNAEASDLAQRKAVYDQTLAETNNETLAFWRASEIINFNRRGTSQFASVLRQVIPFMNAYAQGMNVLGKSMVGRGLSQAEKTQALGVFWGAMMKLSILSGLYALMNADDEEYVNQPPHIRSRFFLIPTGDDRPALKLAMPADLAFITKALPEAAVMGMMRDDLDSQKTAVELRDAFTTAVFGPNFTPQLIKPSLEAMVNYNFFTGAPIVGMGEQYKQIDEQYRESTSQLARLFANVGISPLVADHLLKGYLGTLGGNALTITDIMYEKATGEKKTQRELADYPVARVLFNRTQGSGFKQDFYKLRDEVRAAVGSLNLTRERGDVERVQEIMEDSKRLLQVRTQINRVESTLRKSNNRIEQIQNSNLSPEEKRNRIDREREFQARLAPQIRRMRNYVYDGE